MSRLTIIGLICILSGIFVFAYPMMTYTQPEKIAEIGDVKITANTERTIVFPPVLGGALLVAGLVLVIVGSRK